MAIIQIPRLRSQINAVNSHFLDGQVFPAALRSLFEFYAESRDIKGLLADDPKSLLSYNLPEVVSNELENAFKSLANQHPQAAVAIADLLWQERYFESKMLSVVLVSALDEHHSDAYLQRIGEWITEDLDEKIINKILEESDQLAYIINNEKWMEMINSWLHSNSIPMVRYGLKALGQLVGKKEFQNLPFVFSVVLPIFCHPQLSLHKELTAFIKLVKRKSESETASFLISLCEIYPHKTVLAFTRKCIPLFDEFFQGKLKRAAQ